MPPLTLIPSRLNTIFRIATKGDCYGIYRYHSVDGGCILDNRKTQVVGKLVTARPEALISGLAVVF